MADTRKMSITQGLRELKLLDARINRAVVTGSYIGATKKSSDSVGNVKRETFVSNVKANWQSVTDLIENRRLLKEAIVQSNANTKIEIGGKTYSVAQAIERKNSIVYEKALLDTMKQAYNTASNDVSKQNIRVDSQLDQMLEAYIGKDGDKKITEADLEVIIKPYREKNEWELIDPLDLLRKIEELGAEIDAFESNVDVALSMSNAVTFIEV